MKKKVLFPLLALVLALGLSLPMAAPVAAHLESDPFVTDLIADGGSAATEVVVGNVSVWNDSEELHVKYETTGGWVMTATHLEVATSEPEIPQNRKGNPKVGHFSRSEPHDPAVTEWEEVFDLEDEEWPPCTTLYIAAQAEVQIETMREIISAVTPFSGFDDTSGFSGGDGEVNLATSSLSLLSGFGQLSGYYGASLSNLTHRATRGLGVQQGESDEVDREDPENAESIVITFDSAVYVDWFEIRSLFTKDQPPDEQARVRLYNGATLVDTQNLVGQQDLGSGPGAVSVNYAAPEPESDKLVFDVPPPYETGHEFAVAALEVFQIREETAWGDGTRFVPRGNWAMYFTYHVQGGIGEAGDGWTDVASYYDWEARARHGGTGWRAFIGESVGDNPLWGPVPWLNGGPMWFELIYDDSSGSANFTIYDSSDDSVLGTVSDSSVPGFDGLIGIQGKTSFEAAGSVIVDNVKVNGVGLYGDDGFTAQGTDFVRDLKYLNISGVLPGSFTLTGNLTFTWGANPNDEGPCLSIYVQYNP